MTEKNSAATMSAAEQQLEGCPLPASEVARTLSMRRCVALLAIAAIRASCVVRAAMRSSPFQTQADSVNCKQRAACQSNAGQGAAPMLVRPLRAGLPGAECGT